MNLTYFNLKNLALLIGTAVILVFFLGGCSKGGSNPTPKNTTPKLAITALSVNSGPYTTIVTLTGTGFSSTLTSNQVFFNGVAAAGVYNVNSSGTSLSATVPLAAGTGNVTVTVNGVTATGPVFTYQQAEVVTLLAGGIGAVGSANGTGGNASFSNPNGIVTDATGNVYVADQNNRLIRKITPAGVVSTFAGSGQTGYADGQGTSASFGSPYGLAIDGAGNIYVTEEIGNLIRKITPGGLVSTIAGTAAGLSEPTGLAVDASGNIFVADLGGTIRKITPSNVITTIFHSPAISPYGLALDKSGNIYITSNNEVDKITQAGVISTFASGLYETAAIGIDNNGNLYVSDQADDSALHKITPAQIATAVVSGGGYSFGPVSQVSIANVQGVTIDASGKIYITSGNAVLEISYQ